MNGRDKASRSFNTWIVYAGYLVVFGMIACFAWLAAGLAGELFPTWDARGIIILSLLAAAEALLSYQFVKNSPVAQKHPANYYVTLWAINLFVVKIFTEVRPGLAHLWQNVRLWLSDFPFNILTGGFFINAFIVYAAWQITSLFVSDLYRLDQIEAASTNEWTNIPTARELVRRRFLFLGAVVTLFAGIQLHENTGGTASILPSKILLVVVAFFVLGFCLLSLVKLANLHITWAQAQVDIPPQVPRRWTLYSLLALGVLAFLSIWLPTTYSLGFFETVKTVLTFLTAAVTFLYAGFVFLFGMVAQFFASLFGLKTTTQQTVQPPSSDEFIPQNTTGSPTGDIIRSIIFWTILIVLAIIALRQYLAFNKELVKELKRFRLISWLAGGWERLVNLFKKANRQVAGLLKTGWQRLRGAGNAIPRMDQWDYVNLRRLSTRQKVLFYYHALVRRAGDAGLPRREDQTPYEYARALDEKLRDEKADVDALTDVFVEARYSRHDIPSDFASRAQAFWERIRKFLRTTGKTK